MEEPIVVEPCRCVIFKIFIPSFIHHINAEKPKRERVTKSTSSRKGVAVKYFVKVQGTKKFCVQVCQRAFLHILGVSKDRVQRIARNYVYAGTLPKENRGGSTVSAIYAKRSACVREFIEKLSCTEVHYCRGKTKRQYLPCNLSIAKLIKMYNDQVTDESLRVKRSFFRSIFCTYYNIGFGTPATDVCSRCVELAERIKREKCAEAKNKLIIEKRIHMLKSKAFFNKLREESPTMITFSFDCQKNLVNPKVQDQIAYYSRQLYTYNFTVVKGSSHSKLNKENVTIYTWMEHEYRKGSNEIASAVFHTLSSCDLSAYSKIRLCADGCGGQNRNSTMIAMCMYFLKNIAPHNLKCIEIVFPIRGHSFLPSDRISTYTRKRNLGAVADDGEVTDEDSGEEDNVVINNLLGAQLRTLAEVVLPNIEDISDFDSEDDLPLSRFVERQQVSRPKMKQTEELAWIKTDITPNMPSWTPPYGPKQEISPVESFFQFFDDDVISMLVTPLRQN
nr:unnamed protein product [Callosobruchus chinensis]